MNSNLYVPFSYRCYLRSSNISASDLQVGFSASAFEKNSDLVNFYDENVDPDPIVGKHWGAG